MQQQRIEFIDLAKGFCMLLIVAHHILPFAKTPEIGHFGNSLYYFRIVFQNIRLFFLIPKKENQWPSDPILILLCS